MLGTAALEGKAVSKFHLIVELKDKKGKSVKKNRVVKNFFIVKILEVKKIRIV